MAGRPTDFRDEIAAIICDRLADGESLRIICSDPAMPGRRTVYQWLTAQPEFAHHYAIARDEQADTYADEIIAIADTAEDPAVARLQIDARKWVASKLKPKRYGDRTIHAGDEDNPIAVTEIKRTIIRPD
jgi:hypothetical protein